MKILLDTHALLWWLTDDGRLGRQAGELVEDPGNDVLIRLVSLSEIAVKTRVGKLEADITQIIDVVQQDGFRLLGIGITHLLTLAGFPLHHRDPFDHLLIAQAITEDATFISEARNTARYPVRSLTCSGTTSPSPPGAR